MSNPGTPMRRRRSNSAGSTTHLNEPESMVGEVLEQMRQEARRAHFSHPSVPQHRSPSQRSSQYQQRQQQQAGEANTDSRRSSASTSAYPGAGHPPSSSGSMSLSGGIRERGSSGLNASAGGMTQTKPRRLSGSLITDGEQRRATGKFTVVPMSASDLALPEPSPSPYATHKALPKGKVLRKTQTQPQKQSQQQQSERRPVRRPLQHSRGDSPPPKQPSAVVESPFSPSAAVPTTSDPSKWRARSLVRTRPAPAPQMYECTYHLHALRPQTSARGRRKNEATGDDSRPESPAQQQPPQQVPTTRPRPASAGPVAACDRAKYAPAGNAAAAAAGGGGAGTRVGMTFASVVKSAMKKKDRDPASAAARGEKVTFVFDRRRSSIDKLAKYAGLACAEDGKDGGGGSDKGDGDHTPGVGVTASGERYYHNPTLEGGPLQSLSRRYAQELLLRRGPEYEEDVWRRKASEDEMAKFVRLADRWNPYSGDDLPGAPAASGNGPTGNALFNQLAGFKFEQSVNASKPPDLSIASTAAPTSAPPATTTAAGDTTAPAATATATATATTTTPPVPTPATGTDGTAATGTAPPPPPPPTATPTDPTATTTTTTGAPPPPPPGAGAPTTTTTTTTDPTAPPPVPLPPPVYDPLAPPPPPAVPPLTAVDGAPAYGQTTVAPDGTLRAEAVMSPLYPPPVPTVSAEEKRAEERRRRELEEIDLVRRVTQATQASLAGHVALEPLWPKSQCTALYGWAAPPANVVLPSVYADAVTGGVEWDPSCDPCERLERLQQRLEAMEEENRRALEFQRKKIEELRPTRKHGVAGRDGALPASHYASLDQLVKENATRPYEPDYHACTQDVLHPSRVIENLLVRPKDDDLVDDAVSSAARTTGPSGLRLRSATNAVILHDPYELLQCEHLRDYTAAEPEQQAMLRALRSSSVVDLGVGGDGVPMSGGAASVLKPAAPPKNNLFCELTYAARTLLSAVLYIRALGGFPTLLRAGPLTAISPVVDKENCIELVFWNPPHDDDGDDDTLVLTSGGGGGGGTARGTLVGGMLGGGQSRVSVAPQQPTFTGDGRSTAGHFADNWQSPFGTDERRPTSAMRLNRSPSMSALLNTVNQASAAAAAAAADGGVDTSLADSATGGGNASAASSPSRRNMLGSEKRQFGAPRAPVIHQNQIQQQQQQQQQGGGPRLRRSSSVAGPELSADSPSSVANASLSDVTGGGGGGGNNGGDRSPALRPSSYRQTVVFESDVAEQPAGGGGLLGASRPGGAGISPSAGGIMRTPTAGGNASGRIGSLAAPPPLDANTRAAMAALRGGPQPTRPSTPTRRGRSKVKGESEELCVVLRAVIAQKSTVYRFGREETVHVVPPLPKASDCLEAQYAKKSSAASAEADKAGDAVFKLLHDPLVSANAAAERKKEETKRRQRVMQLQRQEAEPGKATAEDYGDLVVAFLLSGGVSQLSGALPDAMEMEALRYKIFTLQGYSTADPTGVAAAGGAGATVAGATGADAGGRLGRAVSAFGRSGAGSIFGSLAARASTVGSGGGGDGWGRGRAGSVLGGSSFMASRRQSGFDTVLSERGLLSGSESDRTGSQHSQHHQQAGQTAAAGLAAGAYFPLYRASSVAESTLQSYHAAECAKSARRRDRQPGSAASARAASAAARVAIPGERPLAGRHRQLSQQGPAGEAEAAKQAALQEAEEELLRFRPLNFNGFYAELLSAVQYALEMQVRQTREKVIRAYHM